MTTIKTRTGPSTVLAAGVLAALAAIAAVWWRYPPPMAAALTVCIAGAAPLAGWDRRTHRIPNPATAALAAAGLAAAGVLLLTGQIPSMWPPLAGLAIYAAVGLLEALPADALGGGDAKLMAVSGLWTGLLGWAALIPTLLVMHVVMLTVLVAGRARNGGRRVVMGPAAVAGMVAGWLLASLVAG